MNYIKTTIESSLAILKIERESYLNALNKEVINELSSELQILENNQFWYSEILGGRSNIT